MKICHALIHSNNYGKNDFVGVPKNFGKRSSQNIGKSFCMYKQKCFLLKRISDFKKKIDMGPPYISFYSFFR